MTDVPLRPKLAKKARLRWDRQGGRMMLLYPERGLALNETATAIVRLCDGTRTVDEIVASLRANHADAPPSLADDVASFLGALAARGLFEGGEG